MTKINQTKREVIRGAWTAEEDRKLAQVVEINGPKRWKLVAAKAGLNRCGKSCRLRWMNYLRPNIKRGNITDQEEDLILRLHRLLGNRWSLIAGRLPGRTDNEIKNYWNSHLSKRIMQRQEKQSGDSESQKSKPQDTREVMIMRKNNVITSEESSSSKGIAKDSNMSSFNLDDEFSDCFSDEPLNLEWVSKFLDEGLCEFL